MDRTSLRDVVRVASMQTTAAKPASSTPRKAATTPKAAGSSAAVPTAGGTKNPFTGQPAAIKAGRDLYLQNGCSGCHGVGGGGGMGPSLIDDKWQFGSTDDILFKQITGQTKGTMPKVYATMPKNDVWKILAYVRSMYAGDPKRKNW
jgi:cytochrome c(L)